MVKGISDFWLPSYWLLTSDVGATVEDPVTLIAVLKGGLLLVMAGAAVAIFGGLVPMARGKVLLHTKQEKSEEK